MKKNDAIEFILGEVTVVLLALVIVLALVAVALMKYILS